MCRCNSQEQLQAFFYTVKLQSCMLSAAAMAVTSLTSVSQLQFAQVGCLKIIVSATQEELCNSLPHSALKEAVCSYNHMLYKQHFNVLQLLCPAGWLTAMFSRAGWLLSYLHDSV